MYRNGKGLGEKEHSYSNIDLYIKTDTLYICIIMFINTDTFYTPYKLYLFGEHNYKPDILYLLTDNKDNLGKVRLLT